MRSHLQYCLYALLMPCLTIASAEAQQAQSGDGSLADAARQARAAKSKETKPVKTFTNDDLRSSDQKSEGSAPAATTLASKGKEQPAAEAGKDAKNQEAKEQEQAKDKDDNASASTEGDEAEKSFRKRSAELNANLELHKRELSVLQQKLSLAQPVYYNDPQKQMEQEYSRSDIARLTKEVDAKKQEIADDEKALDDLRDQLRREDGDPGWLR